MLTLAATLADGGQVTLTQPLSLMLSISHSLPCDEMVAEFACDTGLGELEQAALLSDGAELFSGIVDRQEHTLDARGTTVVLECRSREAVLLDNEATPRTHYYARLSTIVRSHAGAFGIAGVTGADPYLSRYTVYKGFSVWRAIDLFCRQTLGRSPRVTADGQIDTAPIAAQRELTLSNLLADAQRYTRIKTETNRHEVISAVTVQTRVGYYGTTITNPDAAGVRRTRLLVPSGEWANLPKKGAQELIRASMLAKCRVSVTMPGIVRCGIGDSARLCDAPFDKESLCVGEVDYRLDANGLFTTITLYDQRYL